MRKTYICEDCVFIFQIYATPKKKNRRLFCPNCGENMSVARYYSDDNKNVKTGLNVSHIRWKTEELELIESCVKGDIQPHEVAIRLGRSVNAVRKRVQRMRQAQ